MIIISYLEDECCNLEKNYIMDLSILLFSGCCAILCVGTRFASRRYGKKKIINNTNIMTQYRRVRHLKWFQIPLCLIEITCYKNVGNRILCTFLLLLCIPATYYHNNIVILLQHSFTCVKIQDAIKLIFYIVFQHSFLFNLMGVYKYILGVNT